MTTLDYINATFNITSSYRGFGNNTEGLLWEKNREKAALLMPVIIFLAILIVIGVLGNSLVCYVYGSKSRKSCTDCYIFSLAILDLISCCFGIPVEIADLYYSYMFYASTACRLLKFVQASTVSASNIVLQVVAFDRYYKICKISKQYTAPRARKACILAFAFGIFLTWPMIIILGKKSVPLIADDGTHLIGAECSFDDSYRNTIYPVMYFGLLMFTTLICFTILSVLYLLIGIEIWRRRRMTISVMQRSVKNDGNTHEQEAINGNTHHSPEDRSEVRQTSVTSRTKRKSMNVKRTTVILFIVSVAFIVTFIPFLGGVILREVDKGFEDRLTDLQEVVFSFCLKSFFVNNAINPIIYSFLNVNFRRDASNTIRRLFCCKKGQF